MATPGTSQEIEEIVLDSSDDEADDEIGSSGSSDHEVESQDSQPKPLQILTETEDDSEEDEGEDEDEDEDEEESEEDEDESEEESCSDDSVWEEFEGAKASKSQEAYEANVMEDFHRALDVMVEGKSGKATRLFNRILADPLISVFHKKQVCWEDETDDKLSKMARIFIGCHKNLAVLETAKTEEHYIQVLAICPQNPQVWMEIGSCALSKGDLSFAKYAFERSDTNDGREALISVLYLAKEYHACLEHIKVALDGGFANKLMMFLKERVRNMNKHYRKFHDSLFQEDREYEVLRMKLTPMEKAQFKQRLDTAEANLKKTKKAPTVEHLDPIDVDIDFDQTCETVLTIFCDIFDRIESYSSIGRQLVHFRRWDDRSIYRDCREALSSLVDVVEATEDLVLRTCQRKELENEAEDLMRGLADRRKSVRLERLVITPSQTTETSVCAATSIPQTDLAQMLKLDSSYILPLCSDVIRPSRTPSPTGIPEFLDEDTLLCVIRSVLVQKDRTIKEIIERILLELADLCPQNGSIPKNLHAVVTQLYRRMNLTCGDLSDIRYLKLHVLMDDLGESHGRDYCIRWHFHETWPDHDLALRFIWNSARYSTKETIKLQYLDELLCHLSDDDVLMTAGCAVSLYDVEKYTHRIRKNERIRSIEMFTEAKIHEQVISVMEKDMDFNSVEESELCPMLRHWFTALFALERHNHAAELLCRVIQHLHSSDGQEDFTPLDSWLSQLVLSKIDEHWLRSLAYAISYVLSKRNTICLWKLLYSLIQVIEGPPTVAYLESLDSSEDDGVLPTRALEVLMKAHEALGAEGRCTEKQGEFLKFMMGELNGILENTEVCNALHEDENIWIIVNLHDEIAQCLHCSFGRYSKKRKQLEDHNCRPGVAPTPEVFDFVLSLAMPRPLPLFDDKERLGHDLPDLVTSKFPWFLKLKDQRRAIVDEFEDWLLRLSRRSLSDRVAWPQSTDDSLLEANVWYVMALNNYRQNNHNETRLYSQLFLTSHHATYANKATVSAWAMLAHAIVSETFKLPTEQVIREWEWRTMSYRIGVLVDGTVGVIRFQLANTLYQLATVFQRFTAKLPADDFRRRFCPSVKELREEARRHFEVVTTLPPNEDGRIEEFQWLSFFFLGKLYAKFDDVDVVKVVDNFFEAACSCELGDFFWYPVKINVKKQQNLEPVELHYQLHAAIWKFLRDADNPPLKTLVSLLAYARGFKSHKVVKSGNSLFAVNREIYEVVLDSVVKAAQKEIKDNPISDLLDSMVEKVDLIEELWDLCYKAFELVCDRFPHPKAFYRLAEMEFRRGNLAKAHDHLLKGAFRRRKKEDGFFDHFMEITSPDIERAGSFVYHVERTARLTIAVLRDQDDTITLFQLLSNLIVTLGDSDDTFMSETASRGLASMVIRAIDHCCGKSASPRLCKTEVIRAWQRMQKYSKSQVVQVLKKKLAAVLEPRYGSIDALVAEHMQREDAVRKMNRKRKGPAEIFPPVSDRRPQLPQLPSDPMQLIQMMLANAGMLRGGIA